MGGWGGAVSCLLVATCACLGRSNEASPTTAGAPAAVVGGNSALSLGAKRTEVIHEGDSFRLEVREKKKSEIMANMTLDTANSIFVSMSNKQDPRLVDFVEAEISDELNKGLGKGKGHRNLRSIRYHTKVADGFATMKTQADIDKARDMLTGMMDGAITNYELEIVRCENLETKQKKMMKESQQDVDAASAWAAAAKTATLKAEEVISKEEDTKLPLQEKKLEQTDDKCKGEVKVLKAQLALAKSDVGVMQSVIKAFTCGVVTPAPAVAPAVAAVTLIVPAGSPHSAGLLALRVGSNGSTLGSAEGSGSVAVDDAALVRCHCLEDDQPVIQIRHSLVQAELLKLESETTKEMVNDYLLEAFDESEQEQQQQQQPYYDDDSYLLAGRAPGDAAKAEAEEVTNNLKEVEAKVVGKGASKKIVLEKVSEPRPKTCDEDLGSGINASSYRGCQSHTIKGKQCQKWTSQSPHSHTGLSTQTQVGNKYGLGDHAFCRNPSGNKDTIWCYTNDPNVPFQYCQPIKKKKPPAGIPKPGCSLSRECKVTPGGGCTKMRDNFLTMYSTVVDKRDQLIQDITDREERCKQAKDDIGAAISTDTAKLTAAQSDLASATKASVEDQQQKAQASSSLNELTKEYKETMKRCCDNKNSYLSQLCGLQKIRTELLDLAKKATSVTDCQVSDWTDGECSKSCAGGKQERTRTIIAHSQNGTKCPPLKMERDCNIQKCPVDCKVGEWTAWSACTAECGGGVHSRSRPKTVEPKYGGKPCPQHSETKACNPQACSANCELGDWGEWSSCSKKCNTGHRQRRMPVRVAAQGTGTCPGPESKKRLGTDKCNEKCCMSLLPAGRTILQCKSKVDVIIAIDGGGSFTEASFNQSRAAVTKILEGLGGGDATVALLVFGGPTTKESMDKCTGSDTNKPPDVKKDCGMNWISLLTRDLSALAKIAAKIQYPRSTTLTSMALALSKEELEKGRIGASSVVVVITDGKPMFPRKTSKAAEDLKKTARLIWVQVGMTDATDSQRSKTWASEPWQDNLVTIKDSNNMPSPLQVNTILASMCPEVQ